MTALAFLLCVLVASSVSAQPFHCTALPGSAALARPGAVALLDEIHGTVEVPAVAESLVCQALATGRSVTVGLELLVAEASRVDASLASDDSPAARDRLLSGQGIVCNPRRRAAPASRWS